MYQEVSDYIKRLESFFKSQNIDVLKRLETYNEVEHILFEAWNGGYCEAIKDTELAK